MVPDYDDRASYWNGALSGNYNSFIVHIPIDPDLPIYKHNFVQGVAKNIRKQAQLDMWVAIASLTHMNLEEFLNYDEFWQQAIFESVNDFVKEQNKEQQKAMTSMTSRIEDMRPYSSAMASMPKPQFAMP